MNVGEITWERFYSLIDQRIAAAGIPVVPLGQSFVLTSSPDNKIPGPYPTEADAVTDGVPVGYPYQMSGQTFVVQPP